METTRYTHTVQDLDTRKGVMKQADYDNITKQKLFLSITYLAVPCYTIMDYILPIYAIAICFMFAIVGKAAYKKIKTKKQAMFEEQERLK